MNNQEAIILLMAEKLRSCDEQEMRQICGKTADEGESPDAAHKILDRWTKLDPATQRKVLNLIRTENVHDELHKLKGHIKRLMETPKDKVTVNKEKGQ